MKTGTQWVITKQKINLLWVERQQVVFCLALFEAVLGGISGIGSKSKKLDKETDYLIINFWDKETKSNEVFLFAEENKRKNSTILLMITKKKEIQKDS